MPTLWPNIERDALNSAIASFRMVQAELQALSPVKMVIATLPTLVNDLQFNGKYIPAIPKYCDSWRI